MFILTVNYKSWISKDKCTVFCGWQNLYVSGVRRKFHRVFNEEQPHEYVAGNFKRFRGMASTIAEHDNSGLFSFFFFCGDI